MLSRVQRCVVRLLLLFIGLLLLVLGTTCLWVILDHFRHLFYCGGHVSWSLLLSSGAWCVLGFWLGIQLLDKSLRCFRGSRDAQDKQD